MKSARRLSDWFSRTFSARRCICGNEAVRYGMCDECLEYPE